MLYRIRKRLPSLPRIRSSLFPKIDYLHHPYYHNFYETLTDADRQTALDLFQKQYQAMRKQQEKFARTKKNRGKLSGHLKQMATHFNKDGIVGMRMNPETRHRMIQLTDPHAEALLARRNSMKPEDRGVEGVCSVLCRFDNKTDPMYQFFDALLREHGVYDLCKAHKGVPYQLKFVAMQINQHDDRGVLSTCQFEDGVRADTFYMHVDSTIEALKVIIYRSDICDEGTGAFRYIPGSYRMCNDEEFAIRKANDKSGMDTVNISERRKLFAALPSRFQKKANFGNDLVFSDARNKKLLAREKIYTTDAGDLLLFNPEGIHRGSIFTRPGQRQIFQLPLIPLL